jgi:hypothetical protein
MKLEEAYLSDFDRDCLNLTPEELREKYPEISNQELEESKRIISEQMTELNKRRFLRWLSKRRWVLYRFGV